MLCTSFLRKTKGAHLSRAQRRQGMGSASSPSCLSGSGLQVLSPARPGAHSCPLLHERQKTPPRCWGLGDRSVCKPRSSPGPPHRSPTSFQREGRDYSGRWSWLGLDAISATEQGSLAGSNFLIRTPGCLHVGSQPSLPSCETTPHRPPHRPLTRTGNPYVRESGGRQWGQWGGGAGERYWPKAPAGMASGEIRAPHPAAGHPLPPV